MEFMGYRTGAYRFFVCIVMERDHMEDLGLDGNRSSGSGMGGVDWTALSQDRNRWWVLVNVVMIVWFP